MQPKLLRAAGNQLEFALTENHPLRFTKAKGHRVECVSGLVWITAYNEAPDYQLRPGEAFIVPNNGLTLVEAIGACQVRVELPGLFGHALHRLLALSGWDNLLPALARLRSVALRLRQRVR